MNHDPTFLQAAQSVLKRLATDNHLRKMFAQVVGPDAIAAYEAWNKERGDIATVRAWEAFFQDFIQIVAAEAKALAEDE